MLGEKKSEQLTCPISSSWEVICNCLPNILCVQSEAVLVQQLN